MSKKLTPVERFIKKYSFPGTPAAERMEKDLRRLLQTKYDEGYESGLAQGYKVGHEESQDEEEEPVYDDEHGHGLAE